ncbi:TIGR04283 family arsenosugar biosynthesis glycosyltransferase [Sulfuricystis multivorans]|uniref:TIGR04283 family arsenosugar biosynthesis glycosyltransferase n=1 Tax=Sulfuricystis multivorans TaxID=2211108 RepID=UPI000F8187ED|nr:TIGR04283 family arsenosugar biosynthesis glycosyltransferase [Sulfuricystis multivorans]
MISIVIPVLDEADGIVSALQALQPLRARGGEVIVVDGGSVDATLELARPLADQAISAPRGRARQMNAGAAAASGAVLLFLHADTRLPEEADRLILDALAAGKGQWGRFDVEIAGDSPWLGVVARMMNLRSRLTGIATGDQAMFVSRAAFLAVGGFPEIPLMEDIALSKALRQRGRPLCLTARATTSGRRWETHGVWRTILLMWWLRLRYFFGADPQRLACEYGYVPDRP